MGDRGTGGWSRLIICVYSQGDLLVKVLFPPTMVLVPIIMGENRLRVQLPPLGCNFLAAAES